jgi:uncharacterized protein (TIGR00725 family)
LDAEPDILSASRMPRIPSLRIKVGVMGGAGRDVEKEHLTKAEQLGEVIAQADCILVTGGCPGLPLAAAAGSKRQGGIVVGISPGLSLDEHAYKYESPTAFHDVLIFTGSGLMGREVVNIRSSDIVVIIGGRSGTLGELAIAYDEGKLIGVLTGTGGISDLVGDILAACEKNTGARVIYDDEPKSLITRLLEIYETEHWRHPSCFCRGCSLEDRSVPEAGAVRDVVCGMWILPEKAAAKRTIKAQRYYFCSLECADHFDADTETVLSRSQTAG